jgi:hypothetical protein
MMQVMCSFLGWAEVSAFMVQVLRSFLGWAEWGVHNDAGSGAGSWVMLTRADLM